MTSETFFKIYLSLWALFLPYWIYRKRSRILKGIETFRKDTTTVASFFGWILLWMLPWLVLGVLTGVLEQFFGLTGLVIGAVAGFSMVISRFNRHSDVYFD